MASAGGKKKGLSLEEKIVLVENWILAHPQPYTMKELIALIPKQTPVVYQSVEECVLLLVSENRIEQDRVGVSTLFWRFPRTETQKQNPTLGNQCGNGAVRGGGGRRQLTCAELLRRLSSSDGQPLSCTGVEQLCAAVPPAELRKWHAALLDEDAAVQRRLADEQRRVSYTGEGASAFVEVVAEEEEAQLKADVNVLDNLAGHRARLLSEHKELLSTQNLPETLRQLTAAAAVAMEAANRWTDNYFIAEGELVTRTGQGQRDVRAALQVPANLGFVSESEEEDEEAAAASVAAVNMVVKEAAGPAARKAEGGAAGVNTSTTQKSATPPPLHNSSTTGAAEAVVEGIVGAADAPAASVTEPPPPGNGQEKAALAPRKGKRAAPVPKKRTAQKRAR